MASENQLTMTITLKRGLLFKLLTLKLIQYIFVLLPHKWFWVCLRRSMLVKIGNNSYYRFELEALYGT